MMTHDFTLRKENMMAGKLSVVMSKALRLYDEGKPLVDAARSAKVSVRGLRYALKKRNEKKTRNGKP